MPADRAALGVLHVPPSHFPHPTHLNLRAAALPCDPSMPGMPAGIPTDHVLPDDPTCLPFIERYAADQPAFFKDFAVAYLQLANMGARWA